MIRIAAIIILASLLSLPVIYVITDNEPKEVVEKESLQFFITRGGTVYKRNVYTEKDSLLLCLEDLRKQVDTLLMVVETKY